MAARSGRTVLVDDTCKLPFVIEYSKNVYWCLSKRCLLYPRHEDGASDEEERAVPERES
jgi:hypothetical protein